MKTHMNIPVFIPHAGCNNQCVFCNQRSITGKVLEPSPSDIADTVRDYLSGKGDKSAEIAFFGGSFTGIEKSKQEEYLKAVQPYIASGDVSGIRLSTRPDYISDDILVMLKKYNVKMIELGVQSMCDDVLEASGRGHNSKTALRSAGLIKEYGFKLGLQMMTGLPKDTKEKSIYTANRFVSMGTDCVRVYPTVILKDTPLYELYKRGEYSPHTVEEAVDTVKDVYKIFYGAGIPVIRIGLPETETLGGSVIAGAYHPALGEMVLSRLYRDDLENVAKSTRPEILSIRCDKFAASAVIGQKRCNIEYLKRTYNIPVTVTITGDEAILANNIIISKKSID